MKDVIDSESGQMDIAAFHAIQTVKYSLWQQVIDRSYLFNLIYLINLIYYCS